LLEVQVPVTMSRVALIAPEARLRAMLVALAHSGSVQFVGPLASAHGEALEALRRLDRAQLPAQAGGPGLLELARDVASLEQEGRRDLLAGEVELARRAEAAVRHGGFAVLVGWVPSVDLAALSAALARVGAAAVELPRPPLLEPPTLLRTRGPARRFAPLVATYGAPRYADIDPTPFAALSFVFMFGVMFGDAGHGLLLAALGLALRRATGSQGAVRWRGLAPLRPLWPFAVAGGLAATLFGLLYGEAFGPTGIAPTLWLEPLAHPTRLLGVAVAVGALLLAASYALGVLNRVKESGWAAALRAPSGIAGSGVFAGVALLALGVYLGVTALLIGAAVVAAASILLLFGGFAAESERSGAAVAQALIETLDAVIRIAANMISFTRLAAFGLMHAALGLVVLDGARSLWHQGAAGVAASGAAMPQRRTLQRRPRALSQAARRSCGARATGHGDPPRGERLALAGEHPREQLIVLQAHRLNTGDERLERERRHVAEQEQDGPGNDAGRTAVPERAGAVEHDRAKRGVHQPERR
jgi:V/A-type H+-transporting ATPase subunit I